MRRTLPLLFIALALAGPAQTPTLGLLQLDLENSGGYVLFGPMSSTTTWLIDRCGYAVHTWTSAYHPGHSMYLLDDGTLLRAGNANNPVFNAGGKGGVIQRLDWNSNVLWQYFISDADHCQHHDIFPMPNGHVLAVVWEKYTVAEAVAEGRNPALLDDGLWSEAILELQPIGTDSAAIVWEWHLWDHLVQDFDPLQQNHGVVADHPELVNINYVSGPPGQEDWIHMNAVDYNEDLDQLILSAHNLDEVWVIDHSTTTAEAASHTGGSHGRGGDLLYRWGNPATYDRGTIADQQFFGQHNAQWIRPGLPNAGKILVFNNGLGRPGGNFSSVDIIDQPVDANGDYAIAPGQPFGPTALMWSYTSTPPGDFFSANISSAQPLSNGGLLICEGANGRFFEIDSTEATRWEYINPISMFGPMTQGQTPANNSVFRCTRIDPSHPGLAGQVLIPGPELELDPIVPSLCSIALIVPPIEEENGFSLAPNPASDQVVISLPSAGGAPVIELIDASGRVMRAIDPGNAVHVTVDLADLDPGLYLVRITAAARFTSQRLLVAR